MKVCAAVRADELDRVFALLASAARANKVCPTNAVIAERMGHRGATSATRAIDELAASGRIRVEVSRVWRIVTITATGKRTAWNGIGAAPAGFGEGAKSVRHRILATAQARSNQSARCRAGLPVTQFAIRPGFTGGPARTCQWIAGDPGPTDDCKCGAPSARGVSWCAEHLSRVRESEPRAPGWLRATGADFQSGSVAA